MSELDEAYERVQELESAIADALSALGIGRCFERSCAGCDAEREAAVVSLSATGVKPAGWEYYPDETKEEWNKLAAWVVSHYPGDEVGP